MDKNFPPPAPWTLHGDAVALLDSPLSVRLLVHYTASPVGPYDEYALGTLTLGGPKIVQMSVDSEASMRGGRQLWGFPKTMEEVRWTRKRNRIAFRRKSQIYWVRPFGPRFPIGLPFFTVQNLNGRRVRVPGKVKTRIGLGWKGRQVALVLTDFTMTILPPVEL